MSMMECLLLVLCVASLPLMTASESVPECALRFEDNGVCACSTHDPEGPVKCHNDSRYIEIQPCHCIYYDQHLNKTIVGACYVTCYEHSNRLVEVTSSTEFNDDFCLHGDNGRRGFFCYQCIDTYGMAPYSHLLIDCVPCEHYGIQNWLKYFAIALLPLTLLYILAVLLSCNITSSSLSGIVLVIQCIQSSPLRSRLYLLEGTPNDVSHTLLKIFFDLLAMVNLDFFQLTLPAFCLHPKLNVLEILSLDYITALYPFLLIFITSVLITAYDKQYRLLIWMWKPFKKCFHRYRNTWNIRTSLIEIFASFILLSSIKILQRSFSLLSCMPIYDVTGQKLNYIVTTSAKVEYFGAQHLPFALLAISISIVFVILPLFLLTVYPCRCFHKCLNSCGLRLQTLHVFMDAFQGSYKIQPRDMRSFSAFYLLLRILMLVHAELFLSPQTHYISGIISLASAALVALVQPYKVNLHNTVDSILLLLMGMYFISDNEARLLESLHYGRQWTFASIVQILSILLIVLYFVSLVVWKLLHKKIKTFIRLMKAKWNSRASTSDREENRDRVVIESFDRDLDLSESDSYNSLLGESQQLTY